MLLIKMLFYNKLEVLQFGGWWFYADLILVMLVGFMFSGFQMAFFGWDLFMFFFVFGCLSGHFLPEDLVMFRPKCCILTGSFHLKRRWNLPAIFGWNTNSFHTKDSLVQGKVRVTLPTQGRILSDIKDKKYTNKFTKWNCKTWITDILIWDLKTKSKFKTEGIKSKRPSSSD